MLPSAPPAADMTRLRGAAGALWYRAASGGCRYGEVSCVAPAEERLLCAASWGPGASGEAASAYGWRCWSASAQLAPPVAAPLLSRRLAIGMEPNWTVWIVAFVAALLCGCVTAMGAAAFLGRGRPPLLEIDVSVRSKAGDGVTGPGGRRGLELRAPRARSKPQGRGAERRAASAPGRLGGSSAASVEAPRPPERPVRADVSATVWKVASILRRWGDLPRPRRMEPAAIVVAAAKSIEVERVVGLIDSLSSPRRVGHAELAAELRRAAARQLAADTALDRERSKAKAIVSAWCRLPSPAPIRSGDLRLAVGGGCGMPASLAERPTRRGDSPPSPRRPPQRSVAGGSMVAAAAVSATPHAAAAPCDGGRQPALANAAGGAAAAGAAGGPSRARQLTALAMRRAAAAEQPEGPQQR